MIEQYIDVFSSSGTGAQSLTQLLSEYGGLPVTVNGFGTSQNSISPHLAVRESNGEIYIPDRNQRVFIFNKDTTLNRTITSTPAVLALGIRVDEVRGIYSVLGIGTTNSQIATYDFNDNIVNSVVTTNFRLGHFDFSHGTSSTIWATSVVNPNSRTIIEVDYTTGATVSQFTIANIFSTATAVRRRPTTNEIWIGGDAGRLSYFDQTTLSVTNVFTTNNGTNPGNFINTIQDIDFSFDGSRIFLLCYTRRDGSTSNFFRTVTEIDDTGTIINEWQATPLDTTLVNYGGIHYTEGYTEKVLALSSGASNLFRGSLMIIQ